MDNVTYPIGRFVFEGMTAKQREEWTQDIRRFPLLLKETIAGFTEEQLDTPYRTGAWTVRQVIHHVADFSTNAYIRFKLALTEANPTIKPFLEEAWIRLADSSSMPVEPSISMIDGTYARLSVLLDSMSMIDFERQFYHPERGRQLALKAFLSFTRWHSYHYLTHIQKLKEKQNWS